MSSGAILPRPGDKRERGTVIASVWINDDTSQGPLAAMLLLLMDQPHYYGVVNLQATYPGQDWVTQFPIYAFPNIVPAVEFYSENGGDY